MKRTYHPTSLYDMEAMAKHHLSNYYWDLVEGGATDEITIRRNREAFDAIGIRPRFLTDVGNRDLSTTILGQRISFPVIAAPVGTQTMAHPDGDVATARAAGMIGTIMSTRAGAGKAVEEIVDATSGSVWYSIKHYPDDITEYLVKKAESVGCTAICLTVATPMRGSAISAAAVSAAASQKTQNGTEKSVDGWSPSQERLLSGNQGAVKNEYDLSWADLREEPRLMEKATSPGMTADVPLTGKRLEWLRGLTGLPLVVKEILTAEDARRCVDHGADGIVVSNHGGRTFDTAQPSVEVLQEIAEAIGDKAELYLDSGVRRGTDVLKAMALGARAVMVGRPIFWGLAIGGEAGVRKMFGILLSEFDKAMAFCGCKSVADIDSSLVTARW